MLLASRISCRAGCPQPAENVEGNRHVSRRGQGTPPYITPEISAAPVGAVCDRASIAGMPSASDGRWFATHPFRRGASRSARNVADTLCEARAIHESPLRWALVAAYPLALPRGVLARRSRDCEGKSLPIQSGPLRLRPSGESTSPKGGGKGERRPLSSVKQKRFLKTCKFTLTNGAGFGIIHLASGEYLGQTWEHSSAGRAHALQAWGHRFEPCCSHHTIWRGSSVG